MKSYRISDLGVYLPEITERYVENTDIFSFMYTGIVKYMVKDVLVRNFRQIWERYGGNFLYSLKGFWV